jgi:hypothetical protein
MIIKGITITPVGHGHWKCSYVRFGKVISRILTDSQLIDDAKEGKYTALRDLKHRIRVGY